MAWPGSASLFRPAHVSWMGAGAGAGAGGTLFGFPSSRMWRRMLFYKVSRDQRAYTINVYYDTTEPRVSSLIDKVRDAAVPT